MNFEKGQDMRKQRLFHNILNKALIAVLAATVLTGIVMPRPAKAEILPTFELTAETEGIEAFEVEVVTENLNVRVGRGTSFERLKYNDEYVVLHKGDKVAGFSTGKASNGGEWYEIRWTDDGVEFHGYVYAGYTKLTGEKAVNIPTPTPSPIPTCTPTPTPSPTNTPIPTPSPTPMPEKPEKSGVSPAVAVLIIFLILVIIALLYYVFFRKNSTKSSAEADEKIKKLKNATERAEIVEREKKLYGNSGRKRVDEPEVKDEQEVFDDDYEMNATPMPEEEKSALAAAVREKEELRKMLDGLKYNDVVIHKYFGEGVVLDNADVNNVEVRFNNNGEVRYINKESAAAKRLMMKL